MNSFTFYGNYYEIIKYLNDEQRLKLYDALMKYMFENEEPAFEGLLKGIWINLKMPLDTSKNNGGRGGRPKKEETELKPIENRLKTDKKPNDKPIDKQIIFLISNFLFLKDKGLLREKIEQWVKYKWERKEYYKETGFKSLLARIESATTQYGVDQVINLIDECMANNYKGIIFEKLTKPNKTKVPEWFDKQIEKKQSNPEELKEMEDLLKDFK